MDVHVRVELEAGGPVVIKSGSGAAQARLRHERQRLERARHPGVVALVGRRVDPSGPTSGGAGELDSGAQTPDDEVRTAYAGDPVSSWAGTVAGIAGIGTAVASTLADLHDLGVVHGRIDASHILIGRDGRPRLCGLSHAGDGIPADDVAALAEVLRDLSARARPDRQGALSWLRTSKGTARSLRQVIERATDPVASRRPSARGLADAILTAVPHAALPATPGGVAVDGGSDHDRRPASEVASSEPDTLDRIWAFGDQRSDAERWAAAFGERRPHRSEAVLVDSAAPHDAGPGRPEDDEEAGPMPDDAPWRPRAHDGWPPHDDAGRDLDDRATGVGSPPAAPPRPDGGRAERSMPIARVVTPPWAATPPTDGVDGPWPLDAVDDGDRRPDRAHHTRPGGIGPVLDGGHGDGDDPLIDQLTRDHRVVGGRAALTPRRAPDERATTRSSRGRGAAAVAVVGVAAVVAIAAVVIVGRDDTPPAQPDEAVVPVGCDPVQPPFADVDGDACPEALAVEGTTVAAGGARWTLGEPGDVVTVGDWDCDGDASAALLRPATGDVFVFGAWAPPDQPVTVSSSQQVVGGVGIRAEAGADACDDLMVDLADGGSATVEVTP